MSKPNGGPAFPVFPPNDSHAAAFRGMSLRDYFAAAALQGFISQQHCEAKQAINFAPGHAYAVADAMLAERDK